MNVFIIYNSNWAAVLLTNTREHNYGGHIFVARRRDGFFTSRFLFIIYKSTSVRDSDLSFDLSRVIYYYKYRSPRSSRIFIGIVSATASTLRNGLLEEIKTDSSL